MKFTNEKEREDLIESFRTRCGSLTQERKTEIPEGTKVVFETITEWDEEETEIDDPQKEGEKIKQRGGSIFVCYIKQPHIMTAVVLLDKLNKRDVFSAGFTAWDAMVIHHPVSSSEINQYRYKLGLCQRVANVLDAAFPDIKKN